MWDDLVEQITVERELLRSLLALHRRLLKKCAAGPPDQIELSALAAMLNAFYNGVENVFKRTTLELGDPLPGGESWHKDLLESMTRATSRRNPLISPLLKDRLKKYMEFRHFFRHSYVFDFTLGPNEYACAGLRRDAETAGRRVGPIPRRRERGQVKIPTLDCQ